MTPTAAGYTSARLRAPVGDGAGASSHGSPGPGVRIGTATFALRARVRDLAGCVSDDHGDTRVIQAARADSPAVARAHARVERDHGPDGRVRPGAAL